MDKDDRPDFKNMPAEQISACVAKQLWELIEDEAEANEGYEKFLECCGHKLSSKQKAVIAEHIADEARHVLDLMEMATAITGIKPAED